VKGQFLLIAGLLIVGCASTSTGVPALDASTLPAPALASVAPREIVVTVEDKRVPPVEDTAEIVSNVQLAVNGALKRSRFKVATHAPHALAIQIEAAEQGMGDLPKESCIQIRGTLTVQDLGTTSAIGIGCYEYRHGFGFSMGGGATSAYQGAIEYVLRQLDQAVAQAGQRT
jgi:hypothetical protein